jgi:hypothetical protein
VIQEFHISITPLSSFGQDAYLLRTESVAPGVPLAETQVMWPVDRWLQQAVELFQDPLQVLLTQPEVSGLEGGGSWVQLGQALYNGIFQGRMRDSWLAAQGVAQHCRQPLRLRLGFKDSRLQRLPWELLYGDDRPLASGVDVTLCRYYQPQGAADMPLVEGLAPITTPIQVLVVVSAPDDQERLALGKEVRHLMTDLGRSPQLNGSTKPLLPIELTVLEQPSRPELVAALEQGKFQMLHYAGHSDVSAGGGDLFLVNRHTGLTDWLSGEDLAGLLVNNGIQLAVFNSCRGAYTPQDDHQSGWREQNLVHALVNRGVAGVIAMAERIPDDVAISFTQLLYRNLRQGYPIDLCLSRVRQGLISAYRSDQPFWMLPILYLRPDFNGYLYDTGDGEATGLGLPGGSLNGLLTPPDYSTDPDIAGLAQEVFARHGATAELDITANPDWLGDLEEPASATAAAEAAAVTDLVQRLSHLPHADTDSQSGPTADPAEDLLPQWKTASPVLGDRLPPPPTVANPNPAPQAPSSSDLVPPRSWLNPWQAIAQGFSLDGRWLWAGLGVVGLVAVLGLSVVMLSRDRSPVLSPAPDRPTLGTGANNGAAPTTAGQRDAVMGSATTALATGNLSTARRLLEQLLDQRELETAEAVLSFAEPDQWEDPDIAFVRGRLAWQALGAGNPDYSLDDARRYWEQVLEADDNALGARVGLGFVYYTEGDYDAASQAWRQAVAIDRNQLRDIDPQGNQQVSSPLTTHAYAGLALVHQRQSELATDGDLQEQLLAQGQAFFDQAITIDPTLLNINQLALHWLWASPTLLQEWRTASLRLAVPSR